MLKLKFKPVSETRKRALRERFCKLRTMKRFALTTSIAFVVFGVLSAFAGHFGSTASAAAPLPFVIGGACPNGGVIDPIVSPFCNATGNWLTNGLGYAQHFFEILIVIEIAWSAILWVFQKEQMGDFLAAFIVKMMGIFFFFMFILNAANWLPAIFQSFAQLGGIVTGNTTLALDPDVILNEGIALCQAIFNNLPQPNWVTDPGFFGSNISNLLRTDITIAFSLLVAFAFACIICFLVFIAFLIIAGQLIMTLIEIYIMIGAGAVMLGFTGSRWTMSFGEKYIGYCLSMGVKLFVTYVILALGVGLFATGTNCNSAIGSTVCGDLNLIRNTDLSNINNLGGLALADLSIGATAVIFMMLAMRLPGLAASMMNGSPSLTLSSAVSAFQTAAGAITGTASALVSIPQTMVQEGGLAVMDAAMLAAGGGGGGGAAGGGAAAGGGGGAAASGGGGMSSMSGGGGGGGMDAISQIGGGESGGGGGGGESGGGSGMPDLSKGLQSVPVAGHLANAAMAPISGGMAAAQAALSPLLNMDEGGGGGSVAIGLKLPE